MTITLTLPGPHSTVGPGARIDWSSDFIGPLPVGSAILLNVVTTPAELPVLTQKHLTQQVLGSEHLFVPSTDVTITPQPNLPSEGEAVTVQAQLLNDRSDVIDQSNVNGVWSPTAALGVQILETQGSAQGGGLTDVQAQQLDETHQASWLTEIVNNLTLTDLTSGPSEGPINSFLPDMVFGVIVRIANVPAELVPTTPDNNYWVQDLAVVRVFRGSDLWLRVPIHTSNKLISFWTENLLVGLSALALSEWILNLSVQVDFRPGVTGEVFLMRFP